MLSAAQIDALPDEIVELYERYQISVINDIARRLAKLPMTNTAAWQMQRLIESGKIYHNALKELAQITKRSEAELHRLFQKAGVTAMKFDDDIYRAAGLNPLPLNLSPAMIQVLAAGLQKTGGVMRNLTMTTARGAQMQFIRAADLAYIQISGGAMSYQQAIKAAIIDVAGQGINVIQYPGRTDQLDVAMRRAILTGVNQTVGRLQTTRADEMGSDLVEVTAHIGARPEHAVWQGKIFSRSGSSKRYPHFATVTGYGTVTGLMGANCVIGETIVSGPRIRAAYRRKYSGEIVVIRTARGHELTVTPNHPILTDQGWVAAGVLAEGDNIVSRAGLDGTGGTSPDPNHYKASIEDIFNSLLQRGYVVRLPASAGYFHGDISDDEIDVVFPDGFLADGSHTALDEQIVEGGLGATTRLAGPLHADGALAEIGFGALASANGVMGGSGQAGAPVRPKPIQPGAHCLGPVFGQGDAEFGEVLTNGPLGNAGLGGNFTLPHPGVVHSEYVLGSYTESPSDVRFPVSPVDDTVSPKTIQDRVNRAPEASANAIEGLAGIVELDDVVFIERKSTQGSFIHVYNLETVGGWYYANGIITHNCRHNFYPFFEGISERAYKEAEIKEWADKPVKYNGREMTVYDATQRQREIERKIRDWKRKAGALEAAGLDNSKELAKVKRWQAEMRKFVKQTGLSRQRFREQVWTGGEAKLPPRRPEPKTPMTKPKPTPAPEPAPQGAPVSRAIEIRAKGKTGKSIAYTLDKIDSVHGDGSLPQIPAEQNSGRSRLGYYSFSYGGKPIKISVSRIGEHPELTMAHEAGHFLDHAGIGRGVFASERLEELKDWREAVWNSKAYKTIEDMLAHPGRYAADIPTGVGVYSITPDRGHLRYLLDTKELFARSYAQYIAHRSGDPTLLEQLNKERSDKMYGVRQWADEDFAPIAAAFDKLFRFLGWLR